MRTGDKHKVRGSILISNGHPVFRDGVAHFRLEDVTMADTESVLIAEKLEKITYEGDEKEISFEIRIPEATDIDPRHMYSISVWIDVDGNGVASSDDLYSDKTYRVLTQGFGDFVHIRL